MRTIYSAILTLCAPLLLLRLWLKGRKAPAYRHRWQERFGANLPASAVGKSHVWFHTVSVGETIAAAPIIEAILATPNAPRVVVTTMTPTGSDRVKALYGDRVEHVYCPWDLPWAIALFWRHFNPALVVMMETEVWPNIIAKSKAKGVQIILANARMSEKSAKGYEKISSLSKNAFAGFDLVLAQSKDDARRLKRLGVTEAALKTVGSVKFDVMATADQINQGLDLKSILGGERFVWVAASTHKGEDEVMLRVHRSLQEYYPSALLLIVPRHPERFNDVLELAQRESNACLRTSLAADHPLDGTASVVVGDTMGEMMSFFAAGDAAVIGGSFVPHGGHNVLEPAALGKPVASGPYVHNFQAICDEMNEQQALTICDDEAPLVRWLAELAESPKARDAAGSASLDFLEARRGSLKRQVDYIKSGL